MGIELILKGLLIGLMVSVPLGPIGLFCLQRTLNKGRKAGFYSGLGAASADAIFALVAGLGISIIIAFIKEQHVYFQAIGGAIIVLLGIKIFYTNPVRQLRMQRLNRGRLYEDFFSVFFLTISNPLSTFFFLAMFAGLNIAGSGTLNFFGIVLVVFGVFTGATTWWLILSTLVSTFRHKFRLKHIWWMNKIAGVLIFSLGLAAIFSIWIL